MLESELGNWKTRLKKKKGLSCQTDKDVESESEEQKGEKKKRIVIVQQLQRDANPSVNEQSIKIHASWRDKELLFGDNK